MIFDASVKYIADKVPLVGHHVVDRVLTALHAADVIGQRDRLLFLVDSTDALIAVDLEDRAVAIGTCW